MKSTALLNLKRRGYGLYTIEGQIAVDKVCRFESILDDLEAIRKQVGISGELDLPRAKSRFRTDKRCYREIFDEEGRGEIAELFHEEINLFGYEF